MEVDGVHLDSRQHLGVHGLLIFMGFVVEYEIYINLTHQLSSLPRFVWHTYRNGFRGSRHRMAALAWFGFLPTREVATGENYEKMVLPILSPDPNTDETCRNAQHFTGGVFFWIFLSCFLLVFMVFLVLQNLQKASKFLAGVLSRAF